MAKNLGQIICEEASNAVANVGGDYYEFIFWNQVLTMYGLEPII